MIQAVDRCTELDVKLASLARSNGETKFLRVRADALGFCSNDEGEVDEDMLPTMLVYRGGELEYNWVRVDWEAGRAGVAELMMRYVRSLI